MTSRSGVRSGSGRIVVSWSVIHVLAARADIGGGQAASLVFPVSAFGSSQQRTSRHWASSASAVERTVAQRAECGRIGDSSRIGLYAATPSRVLKQTKLRACPRREVFGRARLLPSRLFRAGRLGRSLALPLLGQSLTAHWRVPLRGARKDQNRSNKLDPRGHVVCHHRRNWPNSRPAPILEDPRGN